MRSVTLTGVLLVLSLVSAISAAEDTVFSSVVVEYEAIRQVLIDDSTEGVAKHAEAIAAAATALTGDFSPAAAGVSTEDAAAVKALLPEVSARASSLAAATTIEDTRTELAELTKPLVRWHELVQGAKPVVAYCPMEKRAWLQPDGAISNPYAPYMLRCGEIVQR